MCEETTRSRELQNKNAAAVVRENRPGRYFHVAFLALTCWIH